MSTEVQGVGKLTDKQEAFCQNYVLNGGNGAQAARDAGYEQSALSMYQQAYENLRKPEIVNRISEIRAEIGDRYGITAEEIVNGFREIAKRGLQEEQVYDKRGNPTGEYKSDLNAAARAFEGLAEIAGINAAKKVELSGGIKVDRSLTDEELEAIATGNDTTGSGATAS